MTNVIRGPEGLWPEDDETRLPDVETTGVERDRSPAASDAVMGSDRKLELGEGDEPVLDDPDRLQFGGRSD